MCFVGHELPAFGKGLNLADRPASRSLLESLLHSGRQRIHCDFFLDLYDVAVFVHRDVLGMSVDGEFYLIETLALFDFGGESINRGALAFCCDGLLNRRRQLLALELL